VNEIEVRVARKTTEALDINAYELVAHDGGELPAFDAGSHVDVHLPNGLVRQYSLCGGPLQQGRYRIAVLRDPQTRGGSQAAHDLVHEGDVIRISAPRNLFALDANAGHSVLLAGGIGVTPLLAMAYQLDSDGSSFELHYFARSRARVAFLSELLNGKFSDKVVLHLDDESPAGGQPLRDLMANLPEDSHLYTCGPTGFLNHVLQTAEALAVPAERVHYETFAAPDPVAGDAFEVHINSTAQTVTVNADETVVAAVARLGFEIPVSCEQGICGTCITRVLKGVPDHRDQYFTDAEHAANDQFTPCCSRSHSKILVLDL
jgi:vanillate O-demethylase ferredoxin subunit